jgi:hypothetical protein
MTRRRRHDHHRMHRHSRAAYASCERQRRREAIIGVYQRSWYPLTDRQVAQALGFDDLNMVRPRITELLHPGAGRRRQLREEGETHDDATNRKVRICSSIIHAKATAKR